MERGDLDDRLDLNYYHPRFAQITQVLDRSVYPVVPLGKHITSIKYGASVKPRYVPEGIPLLRILNLKPNEIDLTDVVKLPEEMRDQLGSAFVQEGDLLISRSGTIGVVAVVDEKANGYAYGSFMIRFSVDDKVAPRYIAYFCNLPMVQLQIQRKRIGAVQGNITIPTIRSLRLPLPPVEMQQDIADRMDAAYRRKRELEARAKRLLASVDGYVLDQVGRNWGADPHAVEESAGPAFFTVWRHNVSRLDPKRYRWQSEIEDTEGLRHLGELLISRREKVDRDEYEFEDLQLITIHFDGTIEPRDVPSWRTDIKGTLYFAHPGDLVYSKIDARNGAIGLVPDELGKVEVTSEYPVYQVKEDVISPAYLKLVLRSNRFTALLKALASGHSGRKRIYPDTVEDIYVPVPAIEKQREIAEEVQHRRDRAAALQEEAERVLMEAKAEVERMILGEREA